MIEIVHPVLIQLAWQTPTLLACLFGFCLAVKLWRRCPTSCLLVMIATAILPAAIIAQAIANQYLTLELTRRPDLMDEVRGLDYVVAVITDTFSAITLGLLFAAVFLGRTNTHGAELDSTPIHEPSSQTLEDDLASIPPI